MYWRCRVYHDENADRKTGERKRKTPGFSCSKQSVLLTSCTESTSRQPGAQVGEIYHHNVCTPPPCKMVPPALRSSENSNVSGAFTRFPPDFRFHASMTSLLFLFLALRSRFSPSDWAGPHCANIPWKPMHVSQLHAKVVVFFFSLSTLKR